MNSEQHDNHQGRQTPNDTVFNLGEDDPLQDSQDVEFSSAEFPNNGQPPIDNLELNPAKLTPSTALEKPYEGMFFDTLKEAGDYYEDYGRQEGFWTRIRSSYKRKQRSDDVTGRLYVCVHEGKHEPNSPTETPIIDKEDVKTREKQG